MIRFTKTRNAQVIPEQGVHVITIGHTMFRDKVYRKRSNGNFYIDGFSFRCSCGWSANGNDNTAVDWHISDVVPPMQEESTDERRR